MTRPRPLVANRRLVCRRPQSGALPRPTYPELEEPNAARDRFAKMVARLDSFWDIPAMSTVWNQ